MGMQYLAQVLAAKNFVVLDTETTGLEKPAEICEIAIIGPEGEVLLNTYVKTMFPIPQAATNVHGITDEMVAGSPTWPELRDRVKEIIKDKTVIVYNATYDRKLMHWTDENYGEPHVDYKEAADWQCAMIAYAEHYGQVNPYWGSYKWQKLIDAMVQQGLYVRGEHSAFGDCQMTLSLLYECVKGL